MLQKAMNIAYLRVSTDTQDLNNQKHEITAFCDRRGIVIDKWITEVVSGAKSERKRKTRPLIDSTTESDTIIVAEMSRLGRSLLDIMVIVRDLLDKKVALIAIKEGYDLTDTLQSKIMAFAFGIAAEIERNRISQRTKAALDYRRSIGIVGGIKKGAVIKKKLTPYTEDVRMQISLGKTPKEIADKYSVSVRTAKAFIEKL